MGISVNEASTEIMTLLSQKKIQGVGENQYDFSKALMQAFGELAKCDTTYDEYIDSAVLQQVTDGVSKLKNGAQLTDNDILTLIKDVQTANSAMRSRITQKPGFGLTGDVSAAQNSTEAANNLSNIDFNNQSTITALAQFGLQRSQIENAGFTQMEVITNSDGTHQLKLSNPEEGYSVTVNRTAENDKMQINKTKNGLSINGGNPGTFVKLNLDENSTMKDIEFSLCDMHIEDNSPTEGMKIIEKGFVKWNNVYDGKSCTTVEYKNLSGKGLDKTQKNIVNYYQCDENGKLYGNGKSISQEGLLMERIPVFRSDNGRFVSYFDKNGERAQKLLQYEREHLSPALGSNMGIHDGDEPKEMEFVTNDYNQYGYNMFADGSSYFSQERTYNVDGQTGYINNIEGNRVEIKPIYTQDDDIAYKKSNKDAFNTIKNINSFNKHRDSWELPLADKYNNIVENKLEIKPDEDINGFRSRLAMANNMSVDDLDRLFSEKYPQG